MNIPSPFGRDIPFEDDEEEIIEPIGEGLLCVPDEEVMKNLDDLVNQIKAREGGDVRAVSMNTLKLKEGAQHGPSEHADMLMAFFENEAWKAPSAQEAVMHPMFVVGFVDGVVIGTLNDIDKKHWHVALQHILKTLTDNNSQGVLFFLCIQDAMAVKINRKDPAEVKRYERWVEEHGASLMHCPFAVNTAIIYGEAQPEVFEYDKLRLIFEPTMREALLQEAKPIRFLLHQPYEVEYGTEGSHQWNKADRMVYAQYLQNEGVVMGSSQEVFLNHLFPTPLTF